MKTRIISCLLFITCVLTPFLAWGQENKAKSLEEIPIRDPYILPDKTSQTYYLYASDDVKGNDGKTLGGLAVYESKNLKQWYGPKHIFTLPTDNWINGKIWAPEVHAYQGKYYLFATINSDIIWKKAAPGEVPYTFRGVQIFVADSPTGPFEPFSKLPALPMDQMTLDGTLWIEDGKPYMVYCHEWVQIRDGGMNLVELKPDLSGRNGEITRLFHASSAPWSTGSDPEHPERSTYVTDGCFLYQTKNKNLLMIWSSFMNGEYAIGIAKSSTGKITGPWIQQSEPLFDKNGGHGMIFRSFDGKLYITFHQPNSPAGLERAKLFELEDTGETLRLKNQ